MKPWHRHYGLTEEGAAVVERELPKRTAAYQKSYFDENA